MRYIGLDLGNRTCGVAISDGTGTIATAYDTVRFREKDLQKCLECVIMIISEKKVDKIVLGNPINMNGTIGPQAEYVKEFKAMLEEATNLEVILFDERLTSVISNNVLIKADLSRKKRKKKVDALAANIILQTYLDKERGGKI